MFLIFTYIGIYYQNVKRNEKQNAISIQHLDQLWNFLIALCSPVLPVEYFTAIQLFGTILFPPPPN